MEKAQLFLYLGNILYLSSYLVKGIFSLRILSITGGLALMGYYFLISGGPLWEPVVWGIAFFLINAVQLVLLYKSRKPIRISPAENTALKLIDETMDPKVFHALSQQAQIYKGSDEVTIGKDQIAFHLNAEIKQFINPFSFLDGNQADTCNLSLNEADNLLVWDRNGLLKVLGKNPNARTAWQKWINQYAI